MNAVSDLSRGLKGRHIQLIALGGTIGVGLFLPSAGAIHTAGPGLLIVYGIGGLAMVWVAGDRLLRARFTENHDVVYRLTRK